MVVKNKKNLKVAYFSMEIALETDIKTYSGGLGVLAGDILRSAAHLNLPVVGVTMLSRNGYFDQVINKDGAQEEKAAKKYNYSKLEKIKETVSMKLGEDTLEIAAWQYNLKRRDGGTSPIYLLDTKLKSNKKKYQNICDDLYGGDKDYRLLQEIVLGRGGYLILKKLGYKFDKIHINEGHGSFVTTAKYLDIKNKTEQEKIRMVKNACVFTTHTPIRATMDIFNLEDVLKYQADFPCHLKNLVENKKLNMTELGMYFSSYVNSVALSHQKVSTKMFPKFKIKNVTNGIDTYTWTSPKMADLFDKYVPKWRDSSANLKEVKKIPENEIWDVHQANKRALISLVKRKKKVELSEDVFTIGFARRFTAYKRPDFILRDMKRLLKIQAKSGKIQIIFAGKAHPHDDVGKKFVLEVNKIANKYKDKIKIIFMPAYDMDMAKVIIPGVDIWLNNPIPPNEASGTSGMKAVCNGVPQFSTFDGWWCEGYKKNKTGWLIGDKKVTKNNSDKDHLSSLYKVLEEEIMPLYYKKPLAWKKLMRSTIYINAPFFSTERVVRDYAKSAYKIKL